MKDLPNEFFLKPSYKSQHQQENCPSACRQIMATVDRVGGRKWIIANNGEIHFCPSSVNRSSDTLSLGVATHPRLNDVTAFSCVPITRYNVYFFCGNATSEHTQTVYREGVAEGCGVDLFSSR